MASPKESAWSGGVDPSPAAEARIEELIQAMQPLSLDLTSDHLDRAFWQRRSMRSRLREAGDEDLGIAALRSYAGCEDEDSLLRQALLEVAAHNAPEASRELLLTLMTTYGFRIDDRTYAAQSLAATSPATYLEAARPYVLRRGRATKTMPDDEFLVRGWVTACQALDRSPVEELADVVTNLMMQDAARHYAAEALGQYPNPKGRRALETVLIESSGNGYLRRKAAQSLRQSLPAETACTLFRTVFEREADINFGTFLGDMIGQLCP